MSDFFGMSHSAEHDVEGAVELKSGAVVLEHVIQAFMPPGTGFSYNEHRILNRSRKGLRASLRDRAHNQSFSHLQHRYTKLLSWPAIFVVIGVLVSLLVFRGFYYSSTRGIASTSNPSRVLSNIQDAAIDSGLGGEFQPRLFEYAKNDHNRAAEAGMVFRRKVLDTLQGMLWGAQQDKLSDAEAGDVRGELETTPSKIVEFRDEDVVYRNFTHFKRTYAEMKKRLKIYVYKEGYKPLVHEAKTGGVYATEGLFCSGWKILATVSLYPILEKPICFCSRTVCARWWTSCRILTLEAPRSTMLHEELHKNAMKVVCNADLKANFDVLKDVSIPQTLKGGNQSDLQTGGLPPDERDFLAFYAGQMHGKVRPVLTRHWKDKDPSMKIYEVLPPEIASNISYADHMKRSKYCLCPRGFEVNSPRIVEAILTGCVPVIIADDFTLPFSDVLDWTKFSTVVAEKDIPHLKSILTSIPDDTYRLMQSRLRLIKRHFLWLEDPEDTQYDSFHMIMYSIWRQSKKIRKGKLKASSGH